jgi:3-phosphoshikimate 1-carboxyvinyltransferase
MGAKVTFGDGGCTVTVEGGKSCMALRSTAPALRRRSHPGRPWLQGSGQNRALQHRRQPSEGDRPHRSIKEELTKMRGKFDETPDSLAIYHSELMGAEIDGRHDHRIVMATAVAGLIAKGRTLIDHAEYARISFPTFYEVMKKLGASIELADGVGS